MSRSSCLYLRASTNPELQANSVAIQMGVLEAFCVQNGYSIDKVFIEYASGGDDERPVMNEALNYAVSNGVNLISWKVDRFARSLSVFSKIQEHLHLLRFCELGDTEPNVMVLSVLLGVAYQERKNTSLRVKASYKHLKKQDPNFKWGNPNMAEKVQPLGEKVRKENASLFNSRIQSIAKDLQSAGYSRIIDIAERLNVMGLSTRRGKPFTYNNLQRILAYK